MSTYTAVILGEAVAQGRPRFSRQGGFVKAYDPAKSRDYKSYVRMIAAQHAPVTPVEGAIEFSLRIYRAIPKGVEDALKGVWYKDDSQIVGYGVLGKWYDERPRIEIMMRELE